MKLKKGNCVELLRELKEKSIDMIFADPPYNLSGKNNLTVKNGKIAVCDKGDWDVIKDIHGFNEEWVRECLRVLKDDGTIWISGTLHNHPSIGVILKKLGLWIINDIIWFKRNAPPLLSQNRFVPSTELIWVASKTKKYYFDYATAKRINNGKQMRNMWEINAERHITKHPTEKPETLLERIIMIGTKKGSTVLDPFMGSGTTGAVAVRQGRNFVGFEISDEYFNMAKKRIENSLHCGLNINDNYQDFVRPQLNFVFVKKAKYAANKLKKVRNRLVQLAV
ncbi:MAG: DNA methyltransferase [Elusimicrobia bacterium RIFOXYA1_FULL_47_7]|nr:MAG: DNA methyltransferase [Elusimicrobia bacterium RIFOXYA12_FULL_49_49]OGS07403.1 MAG: DNA methyltransferase [Elusimicrobia bacterium RIFOXYA1_FULL_47_7]OGS10971.1 MAG: DNA methyltransferase [Elusimicrobia bacterium RIFOXYB1_FULL_48_9]OGS14975.1 MAG: DNA methyltransferase [Elusimicrobia bacterium RIFOXYA2_FULL_47_53]OGS26090.1 MAG: DNA methyltransferase [Elusimicrobia bacterium RIFOXYB12_FULL_50_12]OGS29320.1 MAG: DNA methyltransferase [Elusimicrobia bacterium RIFOXYB2_FULL_46_23]